MIPFHVDMTREKMKNSPLIRLAQDIACACNWAGYDCYIVGGWFRDWFLNLDPHDLDMVTPTPVTILKNLPIPNCSVVPTGEQYGTITFVRDDLSIEVTTCREDFGEFKSSDNRKDVHPTFIHVNLKGPAIDVSRRDFTVNTILVNPFSGQILDLVGGVKDLLKERLRFVGDPVERCREDALRVFRYIRFATRLGFKIDPVIFDVVKDPVVEVRLSLLSAERVRDEWIKTLMAEDGNAVAWAMTMYQELGLLDMWFPEMVPMVDHEQNVYHSHDVWGHSLLAVEASKPELIHRLFALLHDVGKPKCAEFKHDDYGFTFHQHTAVGARIMRDMLLRLKFGHREPVHLDLLYHLVEHHMDAFVKGKMSKMAKRIGLDKFADEYGAQYILDLAWEVGRSDFAGRTPNMDVRDIRSADAKLKASYNKVADYIKDMENPVFSQRDLAIGGHDVMRILGLEPGPEVGKMMRYLFIHVQNGKLENTREELETALLDMPMFEGDE